MNKLITVLFTSLFLIAALMFGQSNLSNKYRLAKTYEQNGELQKAQTIYEELVSAQPENNQYANSLNSVYIKLKAYDSSIKFLSERIKNNPNDVSLHGMLGSTYYLNGNEKKALESWDNGIKANNHTQMNYSIIANYAIQNRAFEPAIKYLEEAKKNSQNPTQFSYQLAQIYSVSMDYTNAAEEYCSVLISFPKQLDYIKRRMETYLFSPGGLEQSIDVAKKYENNSAVSELLIFLFIKSNRFDDAYNLVLDLDKQQNANGLLIYNFANDAYLNNEFSTSSEAFKYIIDNYSDSPFAINSRIGYAKTLESKIYTSLDNNQGWKPIAPFDTTGAYEFLPVLDAYSTLLNQINNLEAENEVHFRRASILMYRFNELDSAEEEFLKIIQNSSLSRFYGIANLKLADISIFKNNLETAKNYLVNSFSSIKTPEEIKAEAKYKLALIQFWNSEFDRSLRTISDISKDLSSNYANEAIELSMIINMGKRDSLNLVKFAKADLNTWQKKFIDAEKAFLELSEIESFFLLNNISLFRYSEILIAQNDYPVAIEILKELSEKEKLNIFTDASLFLLAQVYEFGIVDKQSANSVYEDILKYHPNSLYVDRARFGIARLKIK